jgi:hypothetical protein
MSKSRDGHGRWAERLSAFLDGGLDAEERVEVDAHLAECGDCREVLEELREVKRRAAGLGPVEPSRDLWGGIAATIQAPPPEVRSDDTRIIAFPGAGATTGAGATSGAGRAVASGAAGGPGGEAGHASWAPTRRRLSLSLPQLAAASLALVAVSSAVTWSAVWARDGGTETVAETSAGARSGILAPASTVVDPPADLARELASLEGSLAAARDVLDPNTVRVLERNLGIIEQAIQDSQRALAQDPENDFLIEHLQRVYQRKLEYLREAARVAERSS